MNKEEFDQYTARLTEEERKLRWLIMRHPGHLELRYYLVFMLTANRSHVKALEECRRILGIDHQNLLAREWLRSLRKYRKSGCSVRPVYRWTTVPRVRTRSLFCERRSRELPP